MAIYLDSQAPDVPKRLHARPTEAADSRRGRGDDEILILAYAALLFCSNPESPDRARHHLLIGVVALLWVAMLFVV